MTSMTNKYRAKRKDNGEWVYGTYIPTYLSSDVMYHFIAVYGDMDGVKVRHKFSCDPDSLSRASGLTACGQEAYEGDIIQFYYDGTAEWWTAVLRFGWHDNGGEYGWYLAPIRDTVYTKRLGVWFGENAMSGVTAAVIGNVWDNPELLEKV